MRVEDAVDDIRRIGAARVWADLGFEALQRIQHDVAVAGHDALTDPATRVPDLHDFKGSVVIVEPHSVERSFFLDGVVLGHAGRRHRAHDEQAQAALQFVDVDAA